MEKFFYKAELEESLWLELQERLPERIFDCHYHMYPGHIKSYAVTQDRAADISYWQEALGKLVGRQRLAGAMVMPSIVEPGQIDAVNAFVRQEAAQYNGFCIAHLVTPQDDPAATEQLIENNPQITTFKPYFQYSPAKWASRIDEFFPEWLADLADRHQMSVTLHLAREREALADPVNYQLLQKYCEKYPDMRLILAHNALGHNIENLRRGLPRIKSYPNIWFDCSGISEAASNSYILEYFGPKRLMYGSDLPLDNTLGKIHSAGDGFIVQFASSKAWPKHFATEQYIKSLYEFNTECLISLLTAADQWGLTKADLADIFYHNAAWVYRLQDDGSGPAPDREQYAKARYQKSLERDFSPQAGLLAQLFTQDNTPITDLASPKAQNSPLGFREHSIAAAARKAASLALPGPSGSSASSYGQALLSQHNWADGAAVTFSGQTALELALLAAQKLTGQNSLAGFMPLDGRPDHLPGLVQLPVSDPAWPSLLAGNLAALLVPAESFYTTDSELYLGLIQTARQKKIPLIYDERRIGFRRPPGSLPPAVPSPAAAIYGPSAANGYALGALVAAAGFWQEANRLAWPAPDATALAAAQAMLLLDPNIYSELEKAAANLARTWQEAANETGLAIRLEGSSIFPCFKFTGPDAPGLHQAYISLMAEQGILADRFAYIQHCAYYDYSLHAKIRRAFTRLKENKGFSR